MQNEPPPAKEARVAVPQISVKNPAPLQPVLDPKQIAADLAASDPVPSPVKTPEPLVSFESSKVDTKPTFFEDEKPEVKNPEEAKTPEGDDEFSDVINPGADNFKKLRTSHRELKKTLSDLQKEKEVLTEKVKAYDTGEIVPDVLKAKDEEISRLSQFEKLVNLKGSKEYKEKFVVPIQEARTKLKEIFADYGVAPEELDATVNQALNTQKRPELNRFLQEYLGNDELGALEAKTHVFKAWETQRLANEAEAEPAKAFENLQRETEAVSQVRESERKTRIVNVATNIWTETLNEIRAEGKLTELIHKEDDPEFNAFYPDRLLPQAAKEYGKIVTELGNQGITELPKPLAKAMAKMVMLAHASGVAVETRNRAMENVDTLTQNLTRHHNQLRPPIGGGVARGNGHAEPKKTLTPEEEAYAITNQVLAKR